MNIGLTGGIATGKSTIAHMLADRGAIIIDLDKIAREVVEPGQPALMEIAAHFGQAILNEDGSLHRKALGAIIFADAQHRKALEAIIHPAIRAVMKARMDQAAAETPDKLVVVDVPLLYESTLTHYFDQVMVVYVPREMQLQRLMARDGLSEEEAEKRLSAQMPIEQKKALADIVIDNSGTIAMAEDQVDRWWREKGLT